jgi:hypothetical protein
MYNNGTRGKHPGSHQDSPEHRNLGTPELRKWSSPYITPPSRRSDHTSRTVLDFCEVRSADAARSARVSPVEFPDEVWCVDIIVVSPGVFLISVTLPGN